MLFEYPSKDDWERLVRTFPFERLRVSISDFKKGANSIEDFFGNVELREWACHLQYRLADVQKSYVMLMYYYNKGIPDDEWCISPGRKGQSIEYFPHFQERHFHIKDQFDYYADVFYYKIFSAWDTIGHLLNVLYDLKLDERPNFKKGIEKLKNKNKDLYESLKTLKKDDSDFKEAERLRHDITHNYLPGVVGSSISRPSKNTIIFGGGNYIRSTEIKDNVIKSLNLLVKTLDYIKGLNEPS